MWMALIIIHEQKIYTISKMEEQSNKENKEETLSGSHGEYKVPTRSWFTRFEENLSFLYAHVIEGRMCTTAFACILIVISFLQNWALLYDQPLKLAKEIQDYPMVNDLLLSLRIIGISIIFKSSFVFFAFSYSLYVILILYLLLLRLISSTMGSTLGRASLPIECANIITHIFYWVFTLPLTESLLILCNCTRAETDLGLTCGSQEYWAHLVIIVVLFTVFVVTAYIISIYGAKVNPYSSDAFARYGWNFEECYLLYRICLVVVVNFANKDSYDWLIYGFLGFSTIFFVYYYVKYIPYYNGTVSTTFGACALSFSWTSFVFLIGNVLNNVGVEFGFTQLGIIVGIAVFSPLAYYIRKHAIKSLVLWDNHIEISDEPKFNLLMINLVHLITAPTDTLSQYNLLLRQGFMMMHRKECKDKECPLNSNASDLYLPLFGKPAESDSVEDPIRLRLLLSKMYKQNLLEAKIEEQEGRGRRSSEYLNKSIIERGAYTCLLYAYYIIYYVDNLQAAGVQVGLADTLSDETKLKHLVRVAKMQLENMANEKSRRPHQNLKEKEQEQPHNSKADHSIDPRKVIIYEEKFKQFEALVISTVRKHMEFWRELGNEKPDLQALHDKGIDIINTGNKIKEGWEELKEINKHYPACDLLYGKYLKYILGLVEEGDRCIKSAGSFLNTRKTFESGVHSTTDILFKPQTAVLVVSATQSTKSKILKASNNLVALFGFAKSEIIGQNIELIIPDFYDAHHQYFINRYFETGRQRTIGKMFHNFATHKSRYLLPVNILLKHYYDFHYESVFTVFLTLAGNNNEYIVTNHLGLILGITEGAGEDFGGITPLMLSESEIFMYYFCPDMRLNPQSLKEDYAKIVGDVTYSCMIPKDANGVNAFIPLKSGCLDIKPHGRAFNQKTVNKLIKQNSRRNLTEATYKLNYKNCVKKYVEFYAENYDYPEVQLHLKVFSYKRSNNRGKDKRRASKRTGTSKIKQEMGTIYLQGPESFINFQPSESQGIDQSRYSRVSLVGDKGFFTSTEKTRLRANTLRLQSFSRRSQIRQTSFRANDPVEESKYGLEEVKENPDLDKTRLVDKSSELIYPMNDVSNQLPLQEREESSYVSLNQSTQQLLGINATDTPLTGAASGRRISNVNLIKKKDEDVPDKMSREIKKLRNCSYRKYNPPLVSYLNLTLYLSMATTLAIAITLFVLESNTSSTINRYTQAMNMTRLDSLVTIAEATRALTFISPKNSHGTSLINNEIRSQFYNYSRLVKGYEAPLSYYDWKKMVVKGSADYLLEVQQEILWLNTLHLDVKTFEGLNQGDSVVSYSGMINQMTREIGLLHTVIAQYVNQAYKVYGYSFEQIWEDDFAINFLLNNGLYLLEKDTVEVADAINSSINKEIDARNIKSLILLLVLAFAAILALISLAVILYNVKTQKAELLKSLFDISKPRIQMQARICSNFCRNIDTNQGWDDSNVDDRNAAEEGLLVKESVEGEEDEVVGLVRREGDKSKIVYTKEYKEYLGKFKNNLVKALLFLSVEFIYLLQGYFRPASTFVAVKENVQELLRIKKVYRGSLEIYAYMLEVIGSKKDAKIGSNTTLTSYLSGKLTSLLHDTKKMQEAHTVYKRYFTDSYNAQYSQIMETSVCRVVENIDEEECSKIMGGVLEKGLTLANAAYLHNLAEIFNDYLALHKLETKTLISLLNDYRLIEVEVLKEKYLRPFHIKLAEAVVESVKEIMDNLKLADQILFGFFVGYLVICYFLLICSMASSVKRDLFSTYSLFGILPSEIILQTPRIKNYLLKSIADIDSTQLFLLSISQYLHNIHPWINIINQIYTE
eukprot:TRINITY_DN205_c0_g1_i1.p1 TRINITY_DN205_c0_g1~~TRINITY_DN205_c0_g1_i1.p1  ORF type:complete len:1819 (+),score=126.85 TRINITY_DN205_c0_g1_i1:1558-7014(+)